ncbi:neuronal acetylcholine receptor subunit alpha-2-like [Ylistrum balloti]|uniref:neuronal acetylcholine receptor subunit alpha-2-like n=1 Tax=Ylistrum balloti TaxID=509963 RepID=UPI002905BB9A|nr:neuronal acetylcholine receptor subunit alpha-2-like [Ylistrum balloti]
MKEATCISTLTLMFLLTGSGDAATHTDMVKLHENLTKHYNKYVRPTFNQSEPTIVNVNFNLLSIKELDEKTNKLAIVGIFTYSWNDFQLQWNYTDFGNSITTFLPQTAVWKPDVIQVNPYDEIEPLGYDRQTIRVVYNGDMYWAPANVYQSSCAIDVTFYPFDVQSCFIMFSSLMYDISELRFESNNTMLDLSYFYSNGLWEVKATGIHCDKSSPLIILILQLKRRSIFHVLNTLIPISVIGLLNVLVFLLPAESGERVSFSITVLLAMAVFISIVTDSLPSNSEPNVPFLCYLLAIDLGANALVTVCAILGLRLHHKPDSQKVPKWLKRLMSCRPSIKKKSRCTDTRLESDNSMESWNNSSPEQIKHIYFNESAISRPSEKTFKYEQQDVNDTDQKTVLSTQEPSKNITWKNVAVVLDIVFFVLFLMVLLAKDVVAVIIFLQSQNYS